MPGQRESFLGMGITHTRDSLVDSTELPPTPLRKSFSLLVVLPPIFLQPCLLSISYFASISESSYIPLISPNFIHPLGSVLLSQGWYNELSKIRCLRTTEIYSFTVLKARSPKNQGVHRAMLPPKALEDMLFLTSSSFWYLQAFLGLWLQNSNLWLCFHREFSLCVSLLCAS